MKIIRIVNFILTASVCQATTRDFWLTDTNDFANNFPITDDELGRIIESVTDDDFLLTGVYRFWNHTAPLTTQF